MLATHARELYNIDPRKNTADAVAFSEERKTENFKIYFISPHPNVLKLISSDISFKTLGQLKDITLQQSHLKDMPLLVNY